MTIKETSEYFSVKLQNGKRYRKVLGVRNMGMKLLKTML